MTQIPRQSVIVLDQKPSLSALATTFDFTLIYGAEAIPQHPWDCRVVKVQLRPAKNITFKIKSDFRQRIAAMALTYMCFRESTSALGCAYT